MNWPQLAGWANTPRLLQPNLPLAGSSTTPGPALSSEASSEATDREVGAEAEEAAEVADGVPDENGKEVDEGALGSF